MKKLINLIALVMLVSTNVLTPFSYADVENPEVIPENEVENIEGIGETREKDNEITGEIPNSLWEVEWERSLPLVREEVNESEPEGLKEDVEDSLDDVESPTTDENKKEDTEKVETDEVVQPMEENKEGEKQEENLEDNNEITEQENVEAEIQELQKIQEISTMDTATNSKNIVLQATATEAGQTLKINKYFKNAYTVDWWDGSPIETVSADKTHTYTWTWTYNIILSPATDRWTFQSVNKPLVPTNWTTVADVKIVSMPSLADWFGNNATNPGNYFFYNFNSNWKLTSLPEWSFRLSTWLTTVGHSFFSSFNSNWQLTSLPSWSFDTSNITTVGSSFFSYFNNNWKLTSLPSWSFDTSNITTVGSSFFSSFNSNWQLTSLPSWSFDTSKITTVGHYFFWYFNYKWKLTSLPSWSFDTSNITTVGDDFFWYFNSNWQLISLPSWSFDTSNITTVGDDFFYYFNNNWKLTSLPEWSFRLSTWLTTVGDYFFYYFNLNWQLTSLPSWSFDTSKITTVGGCFFSSFNTNWALTSLPEWSFRLSTWLTTVGNYFFWYFNDDWALTSLPSWSFDTSNITTVGDDFFASFNERWKLTSLPSWSFDTSNITTVGDDFFASFNERWKLTSLPSWSFDTSNITTVGDYFFRSFNSDWQLTSLPEWSFRLSTWLTTIGYWFFYSFNYEWALTSLPSWSFDTSNITTVGNDFFPDFNYNWKLTSLPEWSFDTSKITTVWNSFFSRFNYKWALTSLPSWSFDTSNITTVGNWFFSSFNFDWQLTSLPSWSFDTSNITTVGSSFFSYFNNNWKLTSLPSWSFDTSKITTVGDYFFYYFNLNWQLTSLPESFKLNSVAYNKTSSYQNAFYSPSYTLNRNVSDLVSWITVPSSDMNTFSDNQPWRCGVHSNRLVQATNACSITYDSNWWSTISNPTKKYTANTTWEIAWSWVWSPTKKGYIFSGWWDASGNKVEIVIFPNMDGQTLYANWIPNEYIITFVDWSWMENDVIYTWEYESAVGVQYPEWTKEWYAIHWDKEIPDTMPLNWDTITASWTINEYSITFVDWNWENADVVYTWEHESAVGTQYPEWTKEWYTIHWDKSIPATMPLNWDTITASWTINEYSITFDVDGTLTIITWDYSSPVTPPSNPTKNGYKFIWWDQEIPTTIPAKDTIIKAIWEKLWSSGWWGGGWSSKKIDEDTHWSAEDSQKNTQDDKDTENVIQSDPEHSEWGSEESSNTPIDSSDKSSEWQEILSPSDSSFTKEQKDAYTFAKENWITTKDTIQSAQMNGKLTRIAMAKMLSQYAINVLWQTPDTSKTIKFRDVTSKKDADYDNGVTLAYQLWIMWQNMPNNKFRPNDEVSRAEFVTALSRLLYQTTDGEYKSTSKYYTPHMAKLYNEWIINNTDPSMKERRWYVMIMLMRSSK